MVFTICTPHLQRIRREVVVVVSKDAEKNNMTFGVLILRDQILDAQ